MDPALVAFVNESNRIEGIIRLPTDAEVEAVAQFTELTCVDRRALIDLVAVFQPDARLRDRLGLNVRVGSHRPPPGGAQIPAALDGLLWTARARHPYLVHHEYETLHPFTDGNGRSGRALWLWVMRNRSEGDYDRALMLGFLHCWYYQSLEHSRVLV